MDFDTYQSPFTWRYGSEPMRKIWSERNKRILWRKLWVALADVQSDYGLVSQEQVNELRAQSENIDIPRALQIESDIHHDLMAEIKTFAEQCPLAGGIIHLGATSMDIVDNADALRVKQSILLVRNYLAELLLSLIDLVETYADTPIIALTHLQPAEPSTLGYRFAVYAQDLLLDWDQLAQIDVAYKGKGFKGAVGTAAAFTDLVGLENFDRFEEKLSKLLELDFFLITTQTTPRIQDFQLINALAGIGASLYKFAFDLRILQSPPFGEWSEPFKEKQVGSSAMPFKQNPVNAEKLNSLGRLLAQMPRVAWDNAAHSLLERTLDDSANRRTLLPEAFLIVDEMISVAKRIIQGLVIHSYAVNKNFQTYAPFSATEKILIEAVKKGANRQKLHEVIRSHAMQAWQDIQAGKENSLIHRLQEEKALLDYLTINEIEQLLDVSSHTGIAARRAGEIIKEKAKLSIWLSQHVDQRFKLITGKIHKKRE